MFTYFSIKPSNAFILNLYVNCFEENASDLKLREICITSCFNTDCAIAIAGHEVWFIGGWNSCPNWNI